MTPFSSLSGARRPGREPFPGNLPPSLQLHSFNRSATPYPPLCPPPYKPPLPPKFPLAPPSGGAPLPGAGSRAATHREGQQQLPAQGSAPGACGAGGRHGSTRGQVTGEAPGGRVGRLGGAKGRGRSADWAGRAGRARGTDGGARGEALFLWLSLERRPRTQGAFPPAEGGAPGASKSHRSAPPCYFPKSSFLLERNRWELPFVATLLPALGVSQQRTPPICPISPPPTPVSAWKISSWPCPAEALTVQRLTPGARRAAGKGRGPGRAFAPRLRPARCPLCGPLRGQRQLKLDGSPELDGSPALSQLREAYVLERNSRNSLLE